MKKQQKNKHQKQHKKQIHKNKHTMVITDFTNTKFQNKLLVWVWAKSPPTPPQPRVRIGSYCPTLQEGTYKLLN